MTTAGDGTPRTDRVPGNARPAARSARQPQLGNGHGDSATPLGWNAPRDWNETDEQGYFYHQRQTADDMGINPFFAEPLRDYVLQGLGGQPISVLQAGCLAPLRELGLGRLEEGGFEVSVTVVDDDTPPAMEVLGSAGGAYADVVTGDLRTAAIPPRGFDIVYCAGLLERVRHVELVLDRLVSALKPGGLLLIRTADRHSASALLDRMLPGLARKLLWRKLRPGVPGPFPAVYEKAVSVRGIYSYTLMRGLVIAQRTAVRTVPARPARLSSAVRIACTVISRLTRGHFGDGHDELLYVIRKPQDRFARVV